MKFSRDIQSLSVFKRDSAKLLKQIKRTGQPLILTVNGKAAAVITDPDSYQEFLRLKEEDPTLVLVPSKSGKIAGAQ